MSGMNALLAALPKAPDYRYDWTALERLGPLRTLLEGMERTPQQPEWHGEGDVWVHTRMVCQALAGLAGFRRLADEARQALALAALLHDVGKLRCTRRENGAWVAPRHGPVGAHMARGLLWRDFGLCGTPEAQRMREAVCLLIRFHTRPLHLLEGEAPQRRLLRLAANGELTPLFTLNALCLLAEADIMGRVCADGQALLDEIELARLAAEEAGCLQGPYPFRSARAQRAMFKGGNVWQGQTLYDDSWGEVLLLCGLPGTGKDTWLAENCPGLPTVSLDDIRRALGVSPTQNQGVVVQAARERARELLRARRPFAWNATSLTGLRQQQVELFERYGARVRLVYLETGWEENLRRNQSRKDSVPEDVIGRMLDALEPPERWEAQSVAWECV